MLTIKEIEYHYKHKKTAKKVLPGGIYLKEKESSRRYSK
jgi:hypothetical protein